MIEKCSSPIGDGNKTCFYVSLIDNKIEKCSSPIGDGNRASEFVDTMTFELRNVAPR